MEEKLVFISGNIEDCRNNKYEFISKIIKENSFCVWTSDDIHRVIGEENEIYTNTNFIIENAELVIVDINKDLVNQGIVLQIAHEKNVPVYLLIKESLSNELDMIHNMENVCGKVIYRENLIEAEAEIEKFINNNKVKQYL